MGLLRVLQLYLGLQLLVAAPKMVPTELLPPSYGILRSYCDPLGQENSSIHLVVALPLTFAGWRITSALTLSSSMETTSNNPYRLILLPFILLSLLTDFIFEMVRIPHLVLAATSVFLSLDAILPIIFAADSHSPHSAVSGNR